jgi:hypothetical protein
MTPLNEVNNIPFWEKLKDQPIFCGFKTEESEKGEIKKVPMNSNGTAGLSKVLALNGGRKTLEIIQRLNYPHIGISLMAPIEIQGKYLVCLDFDWKRAENKLPNPDQEKILTDLMGKGHAYEESFSGYGAHIWMLCNQEDIPASVHFGNGCEIEVFSGFTGVSNVLLTGKRYQGGLMLGRPHFPSGYAKIPNKRQESEENDYFGTLSKDEALHILLHIPNQGEGVDYDTWAKVGMILKTELGSAGFELWDEWSQHSDRYRSKDMLYKWNSFNRNEAKAGSLIFLAQKYGYKHTIGSLDIIKAEDKGNTGWYNSQEIRNKLGPVNWLVQDFFEDETISIIWGDTQSFKSFTMLEVCFCIATGFSWHDKDVVQGPVLYVAGEGANGLARRLEGLRKKYNYWEEMPLYVSKGSRDMLQKNMSLEVIKFGNSLPDMPRFIAIDTVNRNFTGEENSAKDVAIAFSNLDKIKEAFKCSIGLVHHSGKNKESIRGSSSWMQNSDATYQMERDGETMNTVLKATKMKDAPLPEPLYLEMKIEEIISQEDELFTTLVTTHSGEPPKREKSNITNQILRYIEQYNEPITIPLLSEALGEKEPIVRTNVNRLYKQGLIKRLGRGKYGI